MFLLIRNSTAFIILSKDDQLAQPTFATNPNLHLFVHPHTLSLSTYGYAKPIREFPACLLKQQIDPRTYFFEIYKDGRCYLASHNRGNDGSNTHTVTHVHLFHPETIAMYPINKYMDNHAYKDITAKHKEMLVAPQYRSVDEVITHLNIASREVARWAGMAVKTMSIEKLKENLELFDGSNIDALHRWESVVMDAKRCPLVEIFVDDIPDINTLN